MPRSGCSALHGANTNLKKKKKVLISLTDGTKKDLRIFLVSCLSCTLLSIKFPLDVRNSCPYICKVVASGIPQVQENFCKTHKLNWFWHIFLVTVICSCYSGKSSWMEKNSC